MAGNERIKSGVKKEKKEQSRKYSAIVFSGLQEAERIEFPGKLSQHNEKSSSSLWLLNPTSGSLQSKNNQ